MSRSFRTQLHSRSLIALFRDRASSSLYGRLRTIGLTREDARWLCCKIKVLLKSKGPAGACEQLKRFCSALQFYLTQQGEYPAWVASYGNKKFPRWFMPKYDTQLYNRVNPGFSKKRNPGSFASYPEETLWFLTRLHACIILKEPTAEQANKFLSSMCAPAPSLGDLTYALSLTRLGWSSIRQSKTDQERSEAFPLVLVPFQLLRKQLAKGETPSRISIQYGAKLVHRSIEYLSSQYGIKVFEEPVVNSAFYPLRGEHFKLTSSLYNTAMTSPFLTAFRNRDKVAPMGVTCDFCPIGHRPFADVSISKTVGKLGMTQEPGGKLRVFASPELIHQAILEPLKGALELVLTQIPEDCTKDQESGAQWVKEQLASGCKVHSVDQSDATNLYPFALQEDILRDPLAGFPQRLVDYYVSVVTGLWEVPEELQKFANFLGRTEALAFTRGQPLGLGPSFFHYGIAHHSLVRGICMKLRKQKKNGTFPYRILGDDIVIADDEVYMEYCKVLEEIGCKIAYSKSYSSKTYAEFAGYRILPHAMYRPGKWRRLDATNTISNAKFYKSNLKHEVSEQVKELLESVLSLPTDLGGIDAAFRDTTDLQRRLYEEDLGEYRFTGELLDRHCAKVYIHGGYTTEQYMMQINPVRFQSWRKPIDFGLTKGWLNSTSIKSFGVKWAIETVLSICECHLDTRISTESSLSIITHFGLDYSAPIKSQIKDLRNKFNSYTHKCNVVAMATPLQAWATKLECPIDMEALARHQEWRESIATNPSQRGKVMKAKTAKAIAVIVESRSEEERHTILKDNGYSLQDFVAVEQFLSAQKNGETSSQGQPAGEVSK